MSCVKQKNKINFQLVERDSFKDYRNDAPLGGSFLNLLMKSSSRPKNFFFPYVPCCSLIRSEAFQANPARPARGPRPLLFTDSV